MPGKTEIQPIGVFCVWARPIWLQIQSTRCLILPTNQDHLDEERVLKTRATGPGKAQARTVQKSEDFMRRVLVSGQCACSQAALRSSKPA